MAKQFNKVRRLNKKFRFQLLQEWLTSRYRPSKVLDVGGGKGLLSLLLIHQGWQATVVDPVNEVYLHKYKDLNTERRMLLKNEEIIKVPRIMGVFEEKLATDFDLLIGLHAHGSNLQIINACKKYDKDFLLLPCCVIDEPLVKVANINWLESLVDYAKNLEFEVKRDVLNFKGQNVLIYTDKHLEKMPILYSITGLPFAGKTTLQKELTKNFGLNLVSIDDIMEERNMWREGHPNQDDWNLAYSLAYEKLNKLLGDNKNVVFDGGSLKLSERETQRQIAKKCGANFKLIYVNTSVEEIKQRRMENNATKARGDLSNMEMETAFKMFEEPLKGEGPIVYNGGVNLGEWIQINIK